MPKSPIDRQRQQIVADVSRYTDRLGLGMDKGIVDVVATIRAFGLNTISSCEGHVDRLNTMPYVIIENPEAKEYAIQARGVTDKKSQAFYTLRDQANHCRSNELLSILDLLDAFYFDYNPSSIGQRMIVQSMPLSLNIIQFQGGELLRILTRAERQEKLAIYHAELIKFNAFLIKNLNEKALSSTSSMRGRSD